MSRTPSELAQGHAQGRLDVEAAISRMRGTADEQDAATINYAVETGVLGRCEVCGHVWIAGEMDPQIANYQYSDGAAAANVAIVSRQAKKQECSH